MRLFVYGSLKRGFFNHNRAGFGGEAKFIGPATALDVSLRRIGRLPYPHATVDSGARVIGELYEVNPSSRMMEYITNMEHGAGYKEHETALQGGGHATMFVSAEPINNGEAIEEWTKEMEESL